MSNVLKFRQCAKWERARKIKKLNPELSNDQIYRQLGIKPEIIILPGQHKSGFFEWMGFLIVCGGLGALIGWGAFL